MNEEQESVPEFEEKHSIALTIITLPPEPASVIRPDFDAPPYQPVHHTTVARRGRMSRIVTVVAGIIMVATILSVTTLTKVARPLIPWESQKQVVIVPTPTPARPVVAGVRSFLCAALPFARLAQERITRGHQAQPNPWFVSVILAQWGIEQGWQMPTYTGYNFGNVSAIAGQPFVPGTGTVGSPIDFAYAATAEQGVADYVLFTQNGHYDAVSAAYLQGPKAQALALGMSPWDAAHYTATGQPGSSLIDVMERFHLQHFDDPNATC